MYNLLVTSVLLFQLLTVVSPLPVQQPHPSLAIPAIDFLNSIGVNSSVSKRGESLDKTIELCRYLGIRWIRTGYEGNIPVKDLLTLHREAGTKFSYGLLSGGTDIARLMDGGKELAKEGALLAFEGVNEPNNWGINYKGNKGGETESWLPVAHLQKDLYLTVKKDPLLKNYPVWSISENGAATDNVGIQYLEVPKGTKTLMPEGTKYADYANCHNYFVHPSNPGLYDNQTWNAADPGRLCKVDGLFGNYGTTWRTKFEGYTESDLKTLPRVTTETGATIDGDLTEEKQARMFLNLYLAQFKRGWSYTALYLLRDRSDEAGNQSFGFYKPDYTPRKSAVYLHNLTTVLNDKGRIKLPGKLNYHIPDQPATVHDLLLQNHDGRFQLIIWGEKVNGTDSIHLNFRKTVQKVNIYNPTIGADPVGTLSKVSSIDLTLSDHPVILSIN